MSPSPLYLLFPKKCVFCEKALDMGAPICICGGCAALLPYYAGEYLFESGGASAANINGDAKLANISGGAKLANADSAASVSNAAKYCDRIVCALIYTGFVKSAVSKYKFYDRRDFGITFAALLCEKIASVGAPRGFDLAACVPLSRARMRERGYNQAAIIARYAADYFGVPFERGLLVRDEHALRQSTLRRGERRRNVQSAFWTDETRRDKCRLAGARVLLIDDVATSMSTLNACAAALKASGAADVTGAVLAAP